MVSYNLQATQGAPAIKQGTRKPAMLGNSFQSRFWENQERYRLKTTAYQGYIDNHQEYQGQNNETEPTDTVEASFANQDSQFLIDYKGYKEYEQFAGFVGIETICCNCEQLFASKNKLHRHLKRKCSRKVKAVSKKAYPVTRLATRVTAAAPLHAPTPTNASTTL